MDHVLLTWKCRIQLGRRSWIESEAETPIGQSGVVSAISTGETLPSTPFTTKQNHGEQLW